jgi:hypothetical protein
MSKYDKNIRQLMLERELTLGRVCKSQDHNHILATTISCLRQSPKTPYKINHYQKI